jgi:hypothetical protein
VGTWVSILGGRSRLSTAGQLDGLSRKVQLLLLLEDSYLGKVCWIELGRVLSCTNSHMTGRGVRYSKSQMSAYGAGSSRLC